MATTAEANDSSNGMSPGGYGQYDFSNLLQMMQQQQPGNTGTYNSGSSGMPTMQGLYGNVYANAQPGQASGDGSASPLSSAMSMGGSNNSLLSGGIQSMGGGGNSGLLQSLMQQLQSSTDQANKDSLAQYQNLLRSVSNTSKSVLGPGGMFSQAQGLMANAGQSQMQQLKLQQQHDLGAADQSAVSRGLGNTTIRQGMLNGVNTGAQLAQNNLTEGINTQKAGLLTQEAGAAENLGNLNANAITARQNQAPDMSTYMNLLMALGRGGGGGGNGSVTSYLGK